MAKNPLEKITYQHILYGAATILSGQIDVEDALLQPEDLERALLRAKPLLEAPDDDLAFVTAEGSLRPGEYSAQQVSSDLRQVLDLYNATVIDGRYIDELATNPRSVAARLDMPLSDAAAAAIEHARKLVVQRFGTSFEVADGKKIVAVAIVVVIVIRAEAKPYDVVIDSSGVIKV